MTTAGTRRRLFIFNPAINERIWCILAHDASTRFSSERRAVERALICAARASGPRFVDVVKETASGGARRCS
jgi:hypothetical protein